MVVGTIPYLEIEEELVVIEIIPYLTMKQKFKLLKINKALKPKAYEGYVTTIKDINEGYDDRLRRRKS